MHQRRGALTTPPNIQEGDFCRNRQRFPVFSRDTTFKTVVRKFSIHKLKQNKAKKVKY